MISVGKSSEKKRKMMQELDKKGEKAARLGESRKKSSTFARDF
jgi:hypothetical protein